jgi:hypothetical protein
MTNSFTRTAVPPVADAKQTPGEATASLNDRRDSGVGDESEDWASWFGGYEASGMDEAPGWQR